MPHLAEARLAAVGQDRVDGEHVVAHDAVADRARAAGVVAGHAADGGAAGGRHVDREPQARGPRAGGSARRARCPARRCRCARSASSVDEPVQVLAEVDDQRAAHRLARLRGAAAARQQRHALLARDRHAPRARRRPSWAPPRRPARSGSARHRWSSARGRSGRTAPRPRSSLRRRSARRWETGLALVAPASRGLAGCGPIGSLSSRNADPGDVASLKMRRAS